MMFMLATFLALVAVCHTGDTGGDAGDSDGHNKVLDFPGPANTKNYLSFAPDFAEDLTALTVCAWQRPSFSDSKRWWFSYAVPSHNNEIVIGERNGYFSLHLGSQSFDTSGAFPVKSPENVWTHLCYCWDSNTGEATISVNGEIVKKQENFAKGSPREKGGNLVIGQEQDTVGGKFDKNQSFLGRLYKINMWDYSLFDYEVKSLYNTGICAQGAADHDPIISWADILSKELKGDASIINGACSGPDDPSHGKILRFPPQSKASTSNFLQFVPSFNTNTFTAFSVCTWFFKTYGDHGRYFFSYANKQGGDNSIVIGESPAGLSFYINGKRLVATPTLFLEQQRWYHLCFTWSSTAQTAIYVDGVQKAAGDMKLGVTKFAGGTLNIGQEQDSQGGGYSASQAFAGSLYNLHMFTVSLTPDQVAEMYGDGTFCGKIDDAFATAVVVSWDNLYHLIPDGDVAFDEDEDAWRHGAPVCVHEIIDENAHNPACWHFEDGTQYGGDGIGFLIGGVEEAKAACFATGSCVALTCSNDKRSGEIKCYLKTSKDRPKSSENKYSYHYKC